MTLQGQSVGASSIRCRCGAVSLSPMVGALYSMVSCLKCEDVLRFERGCFSVSRGVTDLRSHEPPRNSGEGTAVNGPMPLGEKDELHEPA